MADCAAVVNGREEPLTSRHWNSLLQSARGRSPQQSHRIFLPPIPSRLPHLLPVSPCAPSVRRNIPPRYIYPPAGAISRLPKLPTFPCAVTSQPAPCSGRSTRPRPRSARALRAAPRHGGACAGAGRGPAPRRSRSSRPCAGPPGTGCARRHGVPPHPSCPRLMSAPRRPGRGASWRRSWRWCPRGCGAGWRCTRRCGTSSRSSWTSAAARSRGSRPGTGSSPTRSSPPRTSARPSPR